MGKLLIEMPPHCPHVDPPAVGPDCVMEVSFLGRWSATVFAPLGVIAVFAIAARVLKSGAAAVKSMRCAIMLTLFAYLYLSAKALETFRCMATASGPVLVAEPSISCGEGDHVGLAAMGSLIFIFVSVLGPLYALRVLRREPSKYSTHADAFRQKFGECGP